MVPEFISSGIGMAPTSNFTIAILETPVVMILLVAVMLNNDKVPKHSLIDTLRTLALRVVLCAGCSRSLCFACSCLLILVQTFTCP